MIFFYRLFWVLLIGISFCEAAVAQQLKKVNIGFYKALFDGEKLITDPESREVLYYNPNEPICTNSNVIRITLTHEENAVNPIIVVQLDKVGREAFKKAASENSGRKMLVIVDGELLSASVLRSDDFGNVEVSGSFNTQEARELASGIVSGKNLLINLSFYYEDSRRIIEKDIRELDKALISNNDSVLNVLLNNRITFGHSNGWIQDKNAILNDLKTGILSYAKINQDGDLKIDFGGQTASVRRIINVKGKYKGEIFTMRLSVLEIWLIYSDSKWQLWSRQSVKIN